MRCIYLLLFGFTLIISPHLFAQKEVVTFNPYPFSKGKWVYDLRRNLNYQNFNNYANDNKFGEGNSFGLNVGADYFFRDNLGLGLQFSADFAKDKNGSETKRSDWMAWANFTYGRPLNSSVSWYLQPGIGYGGETTKFSGSGSNTEDKIDILGLRINTGFPILLGDGPVYFTPEIGYTRTKIDFDGGEETNSRFGINAKLTTALTCREHRCDGKYGHEQANSRYRQGSQYISYYSKGRINFGSYKTEFDNVGQADETDYTKGSLRVDYARYFVDNLYGGVELSAGTNKTKETGQYEATNTDFLITPKIGFNLPVKAPLNNFFVEAAAGWGFDKNKIEVNNNTSESKDNISIYSGSLGYNIFVADQLALTPLFSYTRLKLEDADDSNPTEFVVKRTSFAVGLRYFF